MMTSNAIMSRHTERGYASDWRSFETFCKARGVEHIPASEEAIGAYADDLWQRNKATRTILRHLWSIHHQHKSAGVEPPELKPLLTAVESRPKRERAKCRPIHRAEIMAMLKATRDDLIGLRDRVTLLLLWELRLQRNACALTFEQLSFPSETNAQLLFEEGLPPLDIQKHDDPGLCLFAALVRWKRETGLHCGRILRSIDRHKHLGESLSGTSQNIIVKRSAKAAGLTGPFHLSSFRRPMLINAKAIGRAGVKGLPNLSKEDQE